LSISPGKKFRTFSFLLVLMASLGLAAQLTFPPSPGEKPDDARLLATARRSLFGGDPGAAYKHLLLSESGMAGDEEWRELLFLTLIGLGKPLDASAFVLGQKNASGRDRMRSELLLKREGPAREPARFLPETQVFRVPKEVARKAVSMAAAGGSVFVLTPEAFYTYPLDGSPQAFRTIAGGKEILDGKGEPLVLTSSSIVSVSGTTQLPLRINDAASFARAPGGGLYILDSAGKVFLLDDGGKIIEERQILIRKPSKIRTDELGRVFILSDSGDDISIYSSGFDPLFVLDPAASGAPVGRVSDFRPDFAGNIIILEKGSKELSFFNFSKRFLGSSSDKAFQADLFSWDGGGSLTVLDRKKSSVMKVSL